MLRSMTGFGQAGRIASGYRIQVEVKSVNHRYTEIAVRMPREWFVYEEAVKKQVSREVKRGRVDVFVNLERDGPSGKRVELDWDLAQGYADAARQLKERLGLQEELRLPDLLVMPDVVKVMDQHAASDEQLGSELLSCVQEAVSGLAAMRMAEGAHLLADLDRRLGVLKGYHAGIAAIAPQAAEQYRIKFVSRLQDLLGQVPQDENRITMEAAIFADRCSIDEELIRLASHFNQFGLLLHGEEQAGRKLDFLIQEMNREINTIGSKANHAELSTLVVEMKAELEKIREQVQNIE
ncbi:MAG: hypothetical protein K0R57_3455 [Paenibacillaceae bacterium]|jgi:uncharacterized protein (TIGR00255 family)|nr:hypothetical protein [Paenibacillaceae bacterium]